MTTSFCTGDGLLGEIEAALGMGLTSDGNAISRPCVCVFFFFSGEGGVCVGGRWKFKFSALPP